MIKIRIKKKLPFFEYVYIFFFFVIFFLISFCISAFVGIGLLSFLGFEYNSIPAVIFFFLIYFCITIPINFVRTSILDVARYVSKLPYLNYKIFEFMLDFLITILIMGVIDTLMNSVNIPFKTEVLFAILSYLLSECKDFLKKDKNENYN